jgi:hypothetical protein
MPFPPEVISAYWLTQVGEGNKKALSLVWVEDEARAERDYFERNRAGK